MLKISSFILAMLFAVVSNLSLAHSNHDTMEPVTEAEALMRAEWLLESMIRQKQLDASWGKDLKQVITRKPVKHTHIWEVKVNNPAEKDVTKQTLYFYLDEMGNSLGVSYTEKK